MYFDRPKDAFFDVESSPLHTEAKDADDVAGSNDGSATIDTVGPNDDLHQSTRVQWTEPFFQQLQLSNPKQGRLLLKLLL